MREASQPGLTQTWRRSASMTVRLAGRSRRRLAMLAMQQPVDVASYP
jgi:hypothetical protein